MTPKEKADELYWKYFQINADNSSPEDKAKECALIAVDEILKEIYELDTNIKIWYWQQVKQEIEKL